MDKYCSNCGKELKEGAEVCLNCGVLLNKNTDKTLSSGKVPGNGKSIAGMVLGIIACVWAFFQILSAGGLSYALEEASLEYYNYTSSFILFWFGFGYTIFSLIPSIIGLPLSISGLRKHKSGKNVAGVILNIIALAISVIMYIYILTFSI